MTWSPSSQIFNGLLEQGHLLTVGHAVGHAVSVDVDGQHSRDLGLATNLLGMLLELMLMLMASIVKILDGQPTCWACC